MHFRFSPTVLLTGILLTAWLMIQSPVVATTITIAQNTPDISRIQQDDVIYLGENHDSASIHQQQLAIITQLQHNNRNSDYQKRDRLGDVSASFSRVFRPLPCRSNY